MARRRFQAIGRGLDQPGRVDRQPGLPHRLRVAGATLPAGAGIGMAAVEGDAAVAERDQVLGGQLRAALVVQAEKAPVVGAGEFAIEQQHVRACVQHRVQFGGVAALGRRQDHAGRRVFHQRGQYGLLPRGRFAGAAEQGHIALLTQRLVHAGGELGEEWIGQVVDDQGHAGRGAPAQIGGAAVVDVALPLQFRFHPRTRVGMHQRAAAQHQRHGRARDADRIGDVGDGHHPLAVARGGGRCGLCGLFRLVRMLRRNRRRLARGGLGNLGACGSGSGWTLLAHRIASLRTRCAA
ncbi:hypothetical protein NB689_003573 [Xanthomonas sacchari]|nr:hypothetical protein [Xanthomonas sacchari]